MDNLVEAQVNFKFKCNMLKATVQGALLSGRCAIELFSLEACQKKFSRRAAKKIFWGNRTKAKKHLDQRGAQKARNCADDHGAQDSTAGLGPKSGGASTKSDNSHQQVSAAIWSKHVRINILARRQKAILSHRTERTSHSRDQSQRSRERNTKKNVQVQMLDDARGIEAQKVVKMREPEWRTFNKKHGEYKHTCLTKRRTPHSHSAVNPLQKNVKRRIHFNLSVFVHHHSLMCVHPPILTREIHPNPISCRRSFSVSNSLRRMVLSMTSSKPLEPEQQPSAKLFLLPSFW